MQSILLVNILIHDPQFLIAFGHLQGRFRGENNETLVFCYWSEGATPLQTT
jgi:hypothetical protein